MDVREELVEQAISHFWYGVSHDIFSEPVKTYAKLAIEALEKENGVTVQEWISVRDKLPDQSGEVLVIVSGNPQKNITLNCAYELAEYDPYDGWIMEMWPEWEDAVVTHWMPLPEMPKGE